MKIYSVFYLATYILYKDMPLVIVSQPFLDRAHLIIEIPGTFIGAGDSDLCQRPLDDDEREEGEPRGGSVED